MVFKAEMALEVVLLMVIVRAPVRDHSWARIPCIHSDGWKISNSYI